ncbi:hypothetical protein BS47DRAFT_1312208 [Hydnum rufescens UP504]|uniref:Uncharacterized protein n=1 Tax=Hydnum rufescens UP504 TaxID=1448309 RepID=A0A9P6BB66_9AGAM|nr:hypothetical protein BS47DRAFT_1312208 [Hydnum rufescens UP504]
MITKEATGGHINPDTFPRLWTWSELKAFVDSGDLDSLKRHPLFEEAYLAWCEEAVQMYGSVVEYMLKCRLRWDLSVPPHIGTGKEYFTAGISSDLVRILPNDWPYSVPHDVSHFLVWSRLPFVHPDIIPEAIWDRVAQGGLSGFTGSETTPKNIGGNNDLVRIATSEIENFISASWNPTEYETAWFLNPPRLQSVPGLAHVHVFARKKTEEESNGCEARRT